MTKYMCIHTLPAGAMTKDQVCQVAQASQQGQQVRGYRSFLNLTEGKILCIIEATDKRALTDWFKKMNIPYDSITEVELEGERGEVRDVKAEPALAGR